MSNDTVADLLTRIRNAQRIGHRAVRLRVSRLNKAVLEILKQEGFLTGFVECDSRDTKHKEYEAELKYYGPYEPVIANVKKVSTSGRRKYSKCDELPKIARGLGVCIVSTSQGVMSDREARKRHLGGEVLAIVS